jgi:hypothetical protein
MKKVKRKLANLGEINLVELLQACNGSITIQLIDAGMIRDQEMEYEFELVDTESICIMPKGKEKSRIIIPSKIVVSPKLLIFFGMYDGDGNKTGNIGFAQNNTELQTFVADAIEFIFPKAFKSKVNILESSKFFESDEIQHDLQRIGNTIRKEIGQSPSKEEVQKRYLLEEFSKMGFQVGTTEKVSITISPKKGGEIKGKRSYEIIVEKLNSRLFLPFLLYIIKQTIDSILESKQFPGIHWFLDPNKEAFDCLDVEKYIQSDRCKYLTPSGRKRGYSKRTNDSHVQIYKSSPATLVKIRKVIYVTPLLCIMFGIYWAEGTTTKKKLFTFRERNETNLGIGFNSSENKSLHLFFDAIFQIFLEPNELISCWLVKIGAKYHAETNALGSKLGVPIARGGPGGDGIARSAEITRVAKEWATNQFPIMRSWAKYYSHVEFTGAGIPRIDIRCRPTSALFFFSLMVDLTFCEDAIYPFLVDCRSVK